jgi:hypothetical protein
MHLSDTCETMCVMPTQQKSYRLSANTLGKLARVRQLLDLDTARMRTKYPDDPSLEALAARRVSDAEALAAAIGFYLDRLERKLDVAADEEVPPA